MRGYAAPPARAEQGRLEAEAAAQGRRLELEVDGGEEPPLEIVRALGSVLGGGALEQVASLRTRRTPFSVARNGTELAEVAIDEVEILVGGATLGSF